MYNGISASGAISNVANTAMSFSFEPPSDGRSAFEFEKPRPNVMLKISAPVTRQRQFVLLQRTRRNC